MEIAVQSVNEELLKQFSGIDPSAEVNSVLDIELVQNGLGGIRLREKELDRPLLKYAEETPEEVMGWPAEFDTSGWALVMAYVEKNPVGGLAVACHNPEIINIRILHGLDDLAVVWDIRVHPDYRRQGIGTELIKAAAEWARNKGYTQLSLETQNTNLPACKFYIKQGFRLGGINRYAYYHHPAYAHEVMLEWYLDLRQ